MAALPRVLVAGGAGFIGSHLCERLLSLGWHVTCVDALSTGRLESVGHLVDHPRFVFLHRDVRDDLSWSGDLIANLASPASPARYMEARVHTLTTNAEGTRRLLDLARRNGARYVQASTSEVYGDPEEHPQSESYVGHVNPIGPRSCYDEGKRYAEALVVAAVAEWDVDARIGRIFNTCGPRMDSNDGRLVVTFVHQLLENQPLTVFGDGRQTRSLCYVDDMVEGLIRLGTYDGLAGTVVNLGNPDERSVLEIAEVLQRIAGREVGIRFLPLPIDDPQRRCPNVDRARRLLGWEPRVSVEECLRRTWEWYNTRR
jgi:nucleoside-diphosphate-sugar epimerase